MASERLNVVILMAVMVIAAAIQMESTDAQKTHNVGGPAGWIIPASPNAYTTWAASQTFSVGDTLVFNFTTGAHTAAQVTKASYDACTTTNSISVWSTGPSSVKLNSSGPHYYICTIPTHCTLGQKVAITVSAAAATPPAASAPSPTTTPSAQAPGSSTTPSAQAPGSSTTPSAQAPGESTTPGSPSSASLVATALPLPILSVAIMALFY